jgi:glutathione synthase/RimK-type ligase-like ATP-grasp enzyme
VTDVHLVTGAWVGVPDAETPQVRDALRARGLSAAIVDWRDPAVAWEAARATIVRSPWNYIEHFDEFVAWVDRVDEVSTLWNPAAVVKWNLHKSYLLELQAAGAPIVPTVLLTQSSSASFDALLDAQGWDAAVVKPAVSVGAIGAGRFIAGDPAAQAHLDAALQKGDALVQQYAASVEDGGEVSVVVIDGRVTHAVRKRPALGDYRTHPQYGGTSEPVEPGTAAAGLARRLLGTLPAAVLYARADVVEISGSWHVMELEVVEPRLWLDARAGLVDEFVDAIARRLAVAP